MTYYKSKCNHCQNEYVISIDDLRYTFYGMPKIECDEYAWKCPTCGHVNTGKNINLIPCYQNGKSNLVFELTDKESEEARKFKDEHKHIEEFTAQGKPTFTALGMQFTYEITPGGLGNCVSIKCNKCGETKDITDSENW